MKKEFNLSIHFFILALVVIISPLFVSGISYDSQVEATTAMNQIVCRPVLSTNYLTICAGFSLVWTKNTLKLTVPALQSIKTGLIAGIVPQSEAEAALNKAIDDNNDEEIDEAAEDTNEDEAVDEEYYEDDEADISDEETDTADEDVGDDDETNNNEQIQVDNVDLTTDTDNDNIPDATEVALRTNPRIKDKLSSTITIPPKGTIYLFPPNNGIVKISGVGIEHSRVTATHAITGIHYDSYITQGRFEIFAHASENDVFTFEFE